MGVCHYLPDISWDKLYSSLCRIKQVYLMDGCCLGTHIEKGFPDKD